MNECGRGSRKCSLQKQMAGGIWPAGCSSRIPGLWCQITGWDQPGEISSGMLM